MDDDNPYNKNNGENDDDDGDEKDSSVRYMENVNPFPSEKDSENSEQKDSEEAISDDNLDHSDLMRNNRTEERTPEKNEWEEYQNFLRFKRFNENERTGRNRRRPRELSNRNPNHNNGQRRQYSSKQQQQRRENRRRGQSRGRKSCSSNLLSIVIGFIGLGVAAWFLMGKLEISGHVILSSYRFKLQNEGVRPHSSINVTEQELLRGLIDDIPLTRLAIDLKEHIKENPWRTCMCMHHLMFNSGKNSNDITPRRFCVIYNKKRGESEVMVNPVAIGRSEDTATFLQKSRGCSKSDLPQRVKRPQKLWVEWGDMILNYENSPKKRMRKNYARFTGHDAACLALVLEELDGKIKCDKAAPKKKEIRTPIFVPAPTHARKGSPKAANVRVEVKTVEVEEFETRECSATGCPSDYRHP